MVRSRSFIAIPPGETIKELLEDRGISQKEFASRIGMSENSVCRFADSVGIDAGIVVGRLQKDGRIAYNYLNNLKEKYDFPV